MRITATARATLPLFVIGFAASPLLAQTHHHSAAAAVPTAVPSAEAQTAFALIKSLAGRVTVLLIEHDIDLVMNISDHVIVMHQGRKLFEGPPNEVRASPAVREAYLGAEHAAA